jgi:hypothetical protein
MNEHQFAGAMVPYQYAGAPYHIVGAPPGYPVGRGRMAQGGLARGWQAATGPRHIVGAPVGAMDAAYPPSYADPQPTLIDMGPRFVREYPLGFGPLQVANGTTVQLPANPQETFRPSRLIVPSTIAASFLVNDIKIGMDSMLLNSNPVSAVAFIETAVGVALGLSTCNIGQTIAIIVTNISNQVQNFLAVLIGTSMV